MKATPTLENRPLLTQQNGPGCGRLCNHSSSAQGFTIGGQELSSFLPSLDPVPRFPGYRAPSSFIVWSEISGGQRRSDTTLCSAPPPPPPPPPPLPCRGGAMAQGHLEVSEHDQKSANRPGVRYTAGLSSSQPKFWSMSMRCTIHLQYKYAPFPSKWVNIGCMK